MGNQDSQHWGAVFFSYKFVKLKNTCPDIQSHPYSYDPHKKVGVGRTTIERGKIGLKTDKEFRGFVGWAMLTGLEWRVHKKKTLSGKFYGWA